MHRPTIRSALLIPLAFIAVPVVTAAQTSRERPSVRAAQTTEAPRIDGVLDGTAWQTAQAIDTFTPQEPREGQTSATNWQAHRYDPG